MENWIKISIILCLFGFFREFRPSEPFVTEFLSGEWRNVTSDQVNREVYPVGTYSYFALLVVVFMITDMLRYKPIIIVSAGCGIVVWCMLLWTTSLGALQGLQVIYGFFMASEVAYYTYIFAKVDRSKYQLVTGHTRSALLIGRFASAVLGQLLYSANVMNFRDLNYITLGSQAITVVISVCLPSVTHSMYFYKTNNETIDANRPSIETTEYYNAANVEVANATQNTSSTQQLVAKSSFSCTHALNLLWSHFISAYSNKIVIQWSFWWALAMGGFLQVQIYVQLLWKEVDDDRKSQYNGGVEAALTLLGAFGAFLAGFLDSKRFNRLEIWIISFCSALVGAFILVSAYTDNVWVAYIMYILFGTVYHFMITIASATVAKNIADDSFALIFGINTLLALAFHSLLTIIFVSENGLELAIRGQFVASGSYFMILAIIYLFVGLFTVIWTKTIKNG